jgi:ornithine cyclodeaminase/alanine dehydrogenase-like protein (mu-crystallin family)
MQIIAAPDVDRLLGYPELIDELARVFAEGVTAPTRHHHTMSRPNGSDATLLLMPAWSDFAARGTADGGYIGVKLVTVSPDNNKTGLPAVMGSYILSDGRTGQPLALIDGQALTVWRTASVSALAARFLARKDAAHLVMIGAGALAPHVVRAHAAVRPITRVTLWNRNRAKAEALAKTLAAEPFDIDVTDDRAAAIADADIVSAATLSTVPLIEGAWLKPGTHVDLIGAFTPSMRETDDAAVARARIFVDTFDGALSEGGDLVQAMKAGVMSRETVEADLAMMCRGAHPGRRSDDDITLFKSTGAALEDFAAGCLVYRAAQAAG